MLTAAAPSEIGHSFDSQGSQKHTKGVEETVVDCCGFREGAHLALLEEDAGNNLVEQADQAKHGVVRQMLLCKLALHMPRSCQNPVKFLVALATSQFVLCTELHARVASVGPIHCTHFLLSS